MLLKPAAQLVKWYCNVQKGAPVSFCGHILFEVLFLQCRVFCCILAYALFVLLSFCFLKVYTLDFFPFFIFIKAGFVT